MEKNHGSLFSNSQTYLDRVMEYIVKKKFSVFITEKFHIKKSTENTVKGDYKYKQLLNRGCLTHVVFIHRCT